MFDTTPIASGIDPGREGLAVADRNSAPAFLTRPVFSSAVPSRIVWTKPGAATTELAQAVFEAGWVPDEALDRAKNSAELVSALCKGVGRTFTVPQRSRATFKLGIHPAEVVDDMGYNTFYRFGSDQEEVSAKDDVAVFMLHADGDQTLFEIADWMMAWNKVHPEAESFCAYVLRNMVAAPHIWTPFDIQDIISENLFDQAEDWAENGEDEIDGTPYDRKELNNIPAMWRDPRYIDKSPTNEGQLSLGGLECFEPPSKLPRFEAKTLLAQKLLATGKQIVSMRENALAARRQFNVNVWCGLDNLAMVLTWQRGDVLSAHWDFHYEGLMNGEGTQDTIIVPVQPKHDELNKFADAMRTYIQYLDLCVHFIELLREGAEHETN